MPIISLFLNSTNMSPAWLKEPLKNTYVGTQYKSIIFYFTAEQKIIALKSKQNFQKNLSNQIMTEILKVCPFYLAEDYHQKYIQKKSWTETNIKNWNFFRYDLSVVLYW